MIAGIAGLTAMGCSGVVKNVSKTPPVEKADLTAVIAVKEEPQESKEDVYIQPVTLTIGRANNKPFQESKIEEKVMQLQDRPVLYYRYEIRLDNASHLLVGLDNEAIHGSGSFGTNHTVGYGVIKTEGMDKGRHLLEIVLWDEEGMKYFDNAGFILE